MSPPSITERGQRTRERLLEAATQELLAHQGHLEFAAVATRAGVSAGAPYRHFASKSDLLVTLVDAFYDEWEALAYRPTFEAMSDDWWEREKERLRVTVGFHYRHPLGSLIHQRLGDAEAVRHHQVRADRLIRGAVKNVSRGKSLGRVPAHIDATLCGPLLMGGVGQCLHAALGGKRPLARKRVLAQLHHFMARVLCIDAPEKGAHR